jgi:hypothetical protein
VKVDYPTARTIGRCLPCPMVCVIECLAKPMPMRCVAATTSGALVPPRCGWHQRIDQRGCPPNETPRRRHAILSQFHRTGYPHVCSPLTFTLPRNSTLNTTNLTNLIKPLSGDMQAHMTLATATLALPQCPVLAVDVYILTLPTNKGNASSATVTPFAFWISH